MTVAFISNSDCGRHDTGWGHPEHVGRLRAVTKALRDAHEQFVRVQHVESRHATAEELALAHEPRYVEAVRQLVERGGGRLDGDTVASEGSWDAATASAGAALGIGICRQRAGVPAQSGEAPGKGRRRVIAIQRYGRGAARRLS